MKLPSSSISMSRILTPFPMKSAVGQYAANRDSKTERGELTGTQARGQPVVYWGKKYCSSGRGSSFSVSIRKIIDNRFLDAGVVLEGGLLEVFHTHTEHTT